MDLSAKEKTNTEMICVTLGIREGALTYRARVTASSIERALEIVGAGKLGRKVRLILPSDSEIVSAREEVPGQDKAA